MGFKEIGRKIQAAREERGMTQVDLAQALGITQAALSNYELGKRRLYLHQIEQIAGVLGKRLDYFMNDVQAASLTHHSRDHERASLEEVMEMIGNLDSQEILSLREFLDYLQWRRNHVSPKR